MVQKVPSCTKQWFLRILFQNLKKSGDTFSLSIYNENVEKITQFIPNEINLSTVSPDELTCALLSMPDVQVTYDDVQKKLIDVANIDI